MDVDGPVMRERTGPWLARLVDGLFEIDCRLTRQLRQDKEDAVAKEKRERAERGEG